MLKKNKRFKYSPLWVFSGALDNELELRSITEDYEKEVKPILSQPPEMNSSNYILWDPEKVEIP